MITSSPRDAVALHEALGAPFGHVHVDLQRVAVAGGLDELGVRVHQRRADDAARGFSVSCQDGTPHCTKKWRDAASIQRKKLGNHTMRAGSQSPNSTRWVYTTVRAAPGWPEGMKLLQSCPR
jgi:hypothetical protein